MHSSGQEGLSGAAFRSFSTAARLETIASRFWDDNPVLALRRHEFAPMIAPQRHLGEALAAVGGMADEILRGQRFRGEEAVELGKASRDDLEAAQHDGRGEADGARAREQHACDIETVLCAVDA